MLILCHWAGVGFVQALSSCRSHRYPTHDERCDRLIIVQERCALNELLRETVGMIDCVSRLV